MNQTLKENGIKNLDMKPKSCRNYNKQTENPDGRSHLSRNLACSKRQFIDLLHNMTDFDIHLTESLSTKLILNIAVPTRTMQIQISTTSTFWKYLKLTISKKSYASSK